jgi:hypothetical protein
LKHNKNTIKPKELSVLKRGKFQQILLSLSVNIIQFRLPLSLRRGNLQFSRCNFWLRKILRVKLRSNKRAIVLVLAWILLFAASQVLLSGLLSFFKSNPQDQSISSLSWAGYVVYAISGSRQTQVNSISASWVVPQINTSAADGVSSVWVGIGGQGQESLIQVGTEQDKLNGQEYCSAWYEMLPSLSVNMGINVYPGDSMAASLTIIDASAGEWSIQMRDLTDGQVFNQNFFYNSTRVSGQWIVERPTNENGQIGNLVNFGAITLTSCSLGMDNTVGAISRFPYSKIQMTNSIGVVFTSISALEAAGSSFTITYLRNG